MNDVCGVSRLVGWYNLWPHLIPLPDVNEMVLDLSDRLLVLATEQLWRVVPHAKAEEIVASSPSASCAARSLRDAALSYGCKGGISVAVVKFNSKKMETLLSSRPEKKRPQSVRRSISLRIPEDTHHYRLEVESPLPPSAYADVVGGEELGDEITDIDALSSYGSPSDGEKWTNIDDPISPLTPPPAFADGFFSSTPVYHPQVDQIADEDVALAEEDSAQLRQHGHSVDSTMEENEEDTLVDVITGFSHSLPNLLADGDGDGRESPHSANAIDL